MPDTLTLPAHAALDCLPEQMANMSNLELLEFVRRRTSSSASRADIAHDHRRFLRRDELERLARLVQLVRPR